MYIVQVSGRYLHGTKRIWLHNRSIGCWTANAFVALSPLQFYVCHFWFK